MISLYKSLKRGSIDTRVFFRVQNELWLEYSTVCPSTNPCAVEALHAVIFKIAMPEDDTKNPKLSFQFSMSSIV